MKLEIKHIAPYLPYGLRIDYIGDYATLKGVDSNGTMCIDEDNEGCHFVNIDNIKPILRPLSDLAKEITLNGETFVPINELNNFYGFDYLWKYFKGSFKNFNHNAVAMASINKLLQWHFDIFGLIENGLALSYNDL